MANGIALESFLNESEPVRRISGEVERLTDIAISLNELLRQTRLELETVASRPAVVDPAVTELLERALVLLNGTGQTPPAATPSQPAPAQRPLAPQTPTPSNQSDLDDFFDLYPNGDSHRDSEEVGDTDGDDVEVAVELDFDLDDEDLDYILSETTSGDLTKNPEITEGFTDLEDSNMTMFVFVRYSHLPYHYTIDGVRYKLVLSGSQIVSSVV